MCNLFYWKLLWIRLRYEYMAQISQRCCRSPSGSTWCWCRRSVSASHSLTWTCTFGNDHLFQTKPDFFFNHLLDYINNSALRKNRPFLLLSEWTSTLTWTSEKLGGGTRVFLRWAGHRGDLTGPSCFHWGAEMAVQGRALNTHGSIFQITLPFLCIKACFNPLCL